MRATTIVYRGVGLKARYTVRFSSEGERTSLKLAGASAPRTVTKPAVEAGFSRYRYGDSNPGFRRERAAS